MAVRIVQLTDLHLYQDCDSRLAGISTWTTFDAVLELVRREEVEFDHLIITGDLAQDEELETYWMLRAALGDWVDRCRIIPGNHDDRANLRKVFPEACPSQDGPLTFSLRDGGWRIIGLDSHVPGEVKGHIGGDQLDWLREQLAEEPAAPTLLFVHHPPISVRAPWIDALGLRDAAELVHAIESSTQVKVVCSGHVHQEFSGRIGAAAMYTTPSTCVQFGARDEKSFDTKMAGYRTILLKDHGFTTNVNRLSGG